MTKNPKKAMETKRTDGIAMSPRGPLFRYDPTFFGLAVGFSLDSDARINPDVPLSVLSGRAINCSAPRRQTTLVETDQPVIVSLALCT